MRPEIKVLTALAGALCLTLAQAQLFGERDSTWRDEVPPPAPALHTDGLVAIDVGPSTTLRFGVDPRSVSISPAGVVRYVVVATSNSGAVNAMYEGLDCGSAMVKVYARHDPQRGWVPATGDWRPLDMGSSVVRHSTVIAQQGACEGPTPNGPVDRLLRDLSNPAGRARYGGH